METENMHLTQLRKVVQRVCSLDRHRFVRSLEYFDSKNKSDAGNIEMLLVVNDAEIRPGGCRSIGPGVG
jgi:hypothetical protein